MATVCTSIAVLLWPENGCIVEQCQHGGGSSFYDCLNFRNTRKGLSFLFICQSLIFFGWWVVVFLLHFDFKFAMNSGIALGRSSLPAIRTLETQMEYMYCQASTCR